MNPLACEIIRLANELCITMTAVPTHLDPDLDDLSATEMAGRLRLSATRLARRLRQQADTGLSPSQLSALSTIVAHGPLTLRALAEREQVAPPTVTRVVTRLEEQGLVVRRSVAGDRRVVQVSATPAGADLLDASRTRKTAWLAARLELLDPDDRARLDAALDVLDTIATDDQ
jgi:DNA-binding MarR family transcriptional regulator